MPVAALLATIWANPKPPILFLLHSIKKMLANLQNKISSKTIMIQNKKVLRMGKYIGSLHVNGRDQNWISRKISVVLFRAQMCYILSIFRFKTGR
jgi:hypothetical protein